MVAAAALYLVVSPRPRRVVVVAPAGRAYAEGVRLLKRGASVSDRLREFGKPARERLRSHFRSVGVAYPPKEAVLLGFKQERELQLYAPDAAGKWRRVYSYPILAASGRPGPKLRMGDCQVPEGVYRIIYMNPNSRYHVSLRLDYPNAFDRAQARRDGRTELGTDIMIHGSHYSIGCLAMGDGASEDLFTLTADIGQNNLRVILCPADLRIAPAPTEFAQPRWTQKLYADLRRELSPFTPGNGG